MQKTNILNKIIDAGIIAVVRANTSEKAIKITDALISGGVNGIELTFTVPHAEQVIALLSDKYKGTNAVIGAGTVLDSASARLAIIAGAQFIVSPSFNKEVAKICNLYAIPYTPGCMTPTEVQTAMTYGSDLIKLFPGSAFGPGMVKALLAPFPYLSIMPTGGVSLDNMADWFSAGVTVVGAGGNLVGPADHDDFDQVTANAKAYVKKLTEIRSK